MTRYILLSLTDCGSFRTKKINQIQDATTRRLNSPLGRKWGIFGEFLSTKLPQCIDYQ